MERKLLLFVFSFLFYANLPAQDGRFMGMGNASIMLDDPWAINNNQAGLASIENPTFAFLYAYRFKLHEIGVQSGIFILPTKTGNFGFIYRRYGYELFAENNFGISYARNLGKYVAIGLQLDYLYYSQTEYYGKKGAFVGELGFTVKPTKQFRIGGHVYNLAQTTLEDYNNQSIPTRMRFGLSYTFIHDLLISIETEKEIDHKAQFKSGIEYMLVDDFYLRAGFSTSPNRFSMGLGYSMTSWSLDMAFATHETMPISAFISFKFQFKKDS